MSSAFCAGMRIPLALMLSADPVPNQVIALSALTVPRALGLIRFLHITSWSPSTPIRLQALSLGGNLSRSGLSRSSAVDRLVSQDCEGDPRHLVGERHGDQLERLLLDKCLGPQAQRVRMRSAMKQHGMRADNE
jgi:hypothetical protein